MNKDTRKHKSKKFKTLKCAPKQDGKVVTDLKGLSCYGKEEIFNMKKVWNSKNTNKITTNNPKEIWKF